MSALKRFTVADHDWLRHVLRVRDGKAFRQCQQSPQTGRTTAVVPLGAKLARLAQMQEVDAQLAQMKKENARWEGKPQLGRLHWRMSAIISGECFPTPTPKTTGHSETLAVIVACNWPQRNAAGEPSSVVIGNWEIASFAIPRKTQQPVSPAATGVAHPIATARVAFNTSEACGALGISSVTLWRLEKRGLIRPVPPISGTSCGRCGSWKIAPRVAGARSYEVEILP